MPYAYAVLGAGRQGIAAAYDMARWGDARRVILADRNLEIARRGAERVNALTGKSTAESAHLDVTDLKAVEQLLTGVDACLSAVPYTYNLDITRAAISAKANVCDLGGHTDIARQQHTLDAEARKAGISVIPNCGDVPGMGTSLMILAVELLDEAVDVYMWDGGIPLKPRPPFGYLLTFNIAGLTNEYAEPAVFLRDWKVTTVETITEVETIQFPEPIGTLEAFVTSGGIDTMPWTFEGRLRTLQNKTLRHPGHFVQLRSFHDLGLWDLKPIPVGGVDVVPRDFFQALFEPKVTFPADKDVVIVRVKAVGKKKGRDAEAIVEVIDYSDEARGFTAMERCTGWSAAIVAELMAKGETPSGAAGVETQVPARPFVEELRRRGINVTEQVT